MKSSGTTKAKSQVQFATVELPNLYPPPPKTDHRWVVCAPYNEGRCVYCGQSHNGNSPFKTEPIDCKEAQRISATHQWEGSYDSELWECQVCGATCSKHRHVPYHEKTCDQMVMNEALT